MMGPTKASRISDELVASDMQHESTRRRVVNESKFAAANGKIMGSVRLGEKDPGCQIEQFIGANPSDCVAFGRWLIEMFSSEAQP